MRKFLYTIVLAEQQEALKERTHALKPLEVGNVLEVPAIGVEGAKYVYYANGPFWCGEYLICSHIYVF